MDWAVAAVGGLEVWWCQLVRPVVCDDVWCAAAPEVQLLCGRFRGNLFGEGGCWVQQHPHLFHGQDACNCAGQFA